MEQDALNTDTICAISTPPGTGGIAVARISGPEAIAIVQRIWHGKPLDNAQSHTTHFGTVTDSAGQPLDEALLTLMRAPRSFTGENTVEISVHGSRYIQRELLKALVAAGARLAQPGEFTRRAFLNGRIDLAQAEGVADMIASSSKAAHRIAINQMKGKFSRRLDALRQSLLELSALLELELDFSEEEVEFASRDHLETIAADIVAEVGRLHRSFAAGQAIKEGIPVAIAGATNAGKSSLLNAILGDERAIVSDIHGTTRDTVEETLESGDFLFRFIDTAGLRHTADTVERIGIERSIAAMQKARIIVALVDSTAPIPTQFIESLKNIAAQSTDPPEIIVALNKTDSPDSRLTPSDVDNAISPLPHATATLSALTGEGIPALLDMLQRAASDGYDNTGDTVMVTNLRHAEALRAARVEALLITDTLRSGIPGDLVAEHVRQTAAHLGEITGQIPSSEILSSIFSRFCIGK